MADTHPWRKCPLGHHWRSPADVDEHQRREMNVREHYRRGSCVKNKSGKDTIYSDELFLIANSFFSQLPQTVTSSDMVFNRGNEYNLLIEGWVKYWNDILAPKILLDPDLVKVLIATESSFNTEAHNNAGKRAGKARGLMQVTDQTLKFLSGEKKELKNHFVIIDQKEAFDPNLNIAAGIRWLFRKKEIADVKFSGASWIEAVMLYKSYKSLDHKKMKEFNNLYDKVKHEKK